MRYRIYLRMKRGGWIPAYYEALSLKDTYHAMQGLRQLLKLRDVTMKDFTHCFAVPVKKV